MNDLCFIYWFTYRIQIAWAFGSMLMPLRHRPDAKVSDRCLIGVGQMVLAIWGYIMCLNFLMCVFKLFSFHQPPVYNHPSPIIQSPNSLVANVFVCRECDSKLSLSYLIYLIFLPFIVPFQWQHEKQNWSPWLNIDYKQLLDNIIATVVWR